MLALMYMFIVFSLSNLYTQLNKNKADRPNILWITSEDNGTYLGCYGDEVASTPNLDELASKGVRFINCFNNAPICAPVRRTWILGMPAITTGTLQMRRRYRVPDSLQRSLVLFKEAGYYVTNNVKNGL